MCNEKMYQNFENLNLRFELWILDLRIYPDPEAPPLGGAVFPSCRPNLPDEDCSGAASPVARVFLHFPALHFSPRRSPALHGQPRSTKREKREF